MRIGVGAIVLRSGQLLLVKRKYPPSRGYWSIPGGHMKAGENIFETASRELLEETGIAAKPLCIIGVDQLRVVDATGVVVRDYILIDVLLDEGDRNVEPRAGSDALDARFIPLYEAIRRVDISLSTKSFIYRLLKTEAVASRDAARYCSVLTPSVTVVYEEKL